jgi:hypothetical protein
MNGFGYKLLGFAVWNGGKWYLRQRMPSPRSLLLKGLAGAGALTVAALAVRRATS